MLVSSNNYISSIILLLIVLFTTASCSRKHEQRSDKISTTPQILATYFWQDIKVPVYQGEVRSIPDTSYREYNEHGKVILHRVLYHPYNEQSWSCDETHYSYDESDSLTLINCYKYNHKNPMIKSTKNIYRDNQGLVDSTILKYFQSGRVYKEYYDYDSLGRLELRYKQKEASKNIRYLEKHLYKGDSLHIIMKNGKPDRPYVFVDSIFHHNNKIVTIKRRVDGGTYLERYGEAMIQVDSMLNDERIETIFMNADRDTLVINRTIHNTPRFKKYVHISENDTLYTEEYLELDKFNRWKYINIFENGKQVLEQHRHTIYAED